MTSKGELRLAARSLAPPTDAESEAVVAGLVESLAAIEPATVLVYLSMPGELPAEQVVDRLDARHRFVTTRTPDVGWLTVHDFGAEREVHRFGYEQPVADAEVVDPASVDVALVPGLCFDGGGGRLGWGKGYYDQLLSSMRPDVVRIGVTLERRLVESVPHEGHDVLMTHLATEVGVRTVTTSI